MTFITFIGKRDFSSGKKLSGNDRGRGNCPGRRNSAPLFGCGRQVFDEHRACSGSCGIRGEGRSGRYPWRFDPDRGNHGVEGRGTRHGRPPDRPLLIPIAPRWPRRTRFISAVPGKAVTGPPAAMSLCVPGRPGALGLTKTGDPQEASHDRSRYAPARRNQRW